MPILLLSLLHATSQEKSDMLGKTRSQILTMGRDRWFQFYSSKRGESTMDMVTAEEVYAQCRSKKNDIDLAKESSSMRKKISSLRKLMQDLARACVQLGYIRTGGGTLWSIVDAGAAVDREEAIHHIINNTRISSKASVHSSNTRKSLLLARKLVDEQKEELESSEKALYAKAVSLLNLATQYFEEIDKTSRTLKAFQAAWLMAFCHEMSLHASHTFS